ncbi:MAG: tetratricopeptide repeat protein [Acidobacteriota bacterium]|nr:tetratricopeptide repeat protein [Acidobacteriota bacterium]
MVKLSRTAAAALAALPLVLLGSIAAHAAAEPLPRDSTIVEKPAPPPPHATVEEIEALRLRLRVAVDRRHAEGLLTAAESFAAMPEDEPLSWLARYYEGLAWYRLGELLHDRDERKLARKGFERAAKRARDALKLRPSAPDAHTLLGAASAAQMRVTPWKRLFWRRRAERALERAAELDPASPRLWLLRGKIAYLSPREEDADRAEGVRHLERATELFELADEPPSPEPSWGHEEAWAYLAMIHMDQGELGEARVALEQAGFANPDSLWITIELQERLAEKIASERTE